MSKFVEATRASILPKEFLIEFTIVPSEPRRLRGLLRKNDIKCSLDLDPFIYIGFIPPALSLLEFFHIVSRIVFFNLIVQIITFESIFSKVIDRAKRSLRRETRPFFEITCLKDQLLFIQIGLRRCPEGGGWAWLFIMVILIMIFIEIVIDLFLQAFI